MMSTFALSQHVDLIESQFQQAEIVINNIQKPMTLTKRREGTKVRVFISVPAAEVGPITKRIVKDGAGNIIWEDEIPAIVNPGEDLTLEIPIQSIWKEGTP